MGRSSGDADGIEPAEPSDDISQAGAPSAGALIAPDAGLTGRTRAIKAAYAVQKQMMENVRRALGKLVTHTSVHALSIRSIEPKATVSSRSLLDIEVPPEPAGYDRLTIPVTDYAAGIPEAELGGGGVDLATVVTVVSANSALGESNVPTYRFDIDYAQTKLLELPQWVWSVQEPAISSVNTALAGGDVYAFSLNRERAVAIGTLPIDPVTVVPGSRRSIAEAFRTMRVAVHGSFSHIYKAPMRRRSAISARGAGLNMAERERLAAVAKTSIENVALIGLFRNVPVTAVSRLSVEEDTAELSIWLKPEAVSAGVPPKTVSLLIGRDINTGKMIQTVG